MSEQRQGGDEATHAPNETGREIEAKFEAPDEATFARLRAASTLGGFAVSGLRPREILDRYLDTADKRFYARRWVCRIRAKGNERLATLKSMDASGGGAVFHRSEYETPVTTDDPATWPESEARRLALEISGGAPLQELVRLRQIRTVGQLKDGDRPVAELSLDEVYIGDGPPRYGLEAELVAGGTPEDLDRLVEDLQDHWGLTPQPQSKFEQAWAAAGLTA